VYSSPNIIRVSKFIGMRWMDNVACMGERRGAVRIGFWCGNQRERDHLEDEGVDGRIILKFMFQKWDGGMDWSDLAQGRVR
jgi:hypothetical protein